MRRLRLKVSGDGPDAVAPAATRAEPGAGRPPAGAEPGVARTLQLPTAVYPGWEAIYEDNAARIHRLMYSKVGNRTEAEDLTSQVFLTALKSLRTTATVGEVRSYLLATARTVLASHWQRTLGRQVTVIDVDVADLNDFAQPVSQQISSRAGDQAAQILAALSERHRRILVLRFMLGCTIREAAADMGITVANAKVLQHRALRKAAGLDAFPENTGHSDIPRILDHERARSSQARNAPDAPHGDGR
jgi:RNA polymerase sigma-70 factor (ECF subfamily)